MTPMLLGGYLFIASFLSFWALVLYSMFMLGLRRDHRFAPGVRAWERTILGRAVPILLGATFAVTFGAMLGVFAAASM